MKVAPRTFRIQWDLHAWSSVIASLPLFVVFYCGIFAVFYPEIARWQGPATEPAVTAPAPSRTSYDRVLSELQSQLAIPPGASIAVRLPFGGSAEPGLETVSVRHKASRLDRDLHFDRVSGEPPAQAGEHSRLADELYVMHFLSRLPWGIELSGLLAIALFVAVVSGTVIQLKDLWRQLWQFRPRLALRISASDVHKVLGVFGLPFAALFAWSGALLGLWAILSAPLQYGVYGGDAAALEAARSQRPSPTLQAGRPAAHLLSLDELATHAAARAQAHFGRPELNPTRLDIESYADENARFRFRFANRAFEAPRSVELGGDGRVLAIEGDGSTPSDAMDRVLFDLPFARFGGYLVKAMYALLSLGVCAVIVTGNLVWLERRDRARAHRGNRWLERSTVGVGLGLVLASALYFAANRVLPVGLTRRAELEFWIFLASWGLASVAVFVRFTARQWARGLCRAAALVFGTVVLSDVVLRPSHVLAALRGDSDTLLGAESLLVCLAVLCAWLGRIPTTAR